MASDALIPHRYETRVRYGETDQMGIAHHGAYVAWLELGRTEMMKSLGYHYRKMEEEGLLLPVLDMQIRYRKSLKYDDVVVVETKVETARRFKILFSYVIRNEGGELVAEASTWLGSIDRNGKPKPLPDNAFGTQA